jgi:hypothetical protein
LFAQARRLFELGTLVMPILILGAAVATVFVSSAGAASPSPSTYWTECSSRVKVEGVEVSPVEVLHLTCAQANRAIRRARILLTPGGPIFSTHGYTCSSTNILPRVDPSPIELPAAERCTGAQHRQLSFIWDWAS